MLASNQTDTEIESISTVAVGQVWKDNDPRIKDRFIHILAVEDGKVSFSVGYTTRVRKASVKRFNGRRNGYSPTIGQRFNG